MIPVRKPVVVSACLIGINTRYNGGNALSSEAMEMLKGNFAIPACPEQLGGLPTPRPKASIIEGEGSGVLDGKSRVKDENGADVTGQFLKGAEEFLKIVRLSGAGTVLLKEKSPSCGVSLICGDSGCISGSGVAATLLKREGFDIKGF